MQHDPNWAPAAAAPGLPSQTTTRMKTWITLAESLLFARLAAVLMVAPGWGEQAAPPTLRLGLAVLVTATLAPTLAVSTPRLPASIVMAIPMILSEIMIGIILGLGARIMMSALQVAGATAGIASGLGFAQQIDPIASQPAAIFSGFFSLMGVVLLMSAGLHRLWKVFTLQVAGARSGERLRRLGVDLLESAA